MGCRIAYIGFGEAGTAFATPGARAYDRLTDHPATRAAKQADFAAAGVTGCARAAEALQDAEIVFSLVTADQALPAALAGAAWLAPGALWLDMNSVAPATKLQAARAVEAGAGRYVDVAVMAPVQPGEHATPLLVSGPHAEEAARHLLELGFTNVRSLGGAVGSASSIKMIRSVLVKGIEALTAECLLAAEAAGVTADVIASLDASTSARNWAARADYHLDRMMVHGLRRAAEMEEVVTTLEALGTGAQLTRATAERQRAIGALGFRNPPSGLPAKLAAIAHHEEDRAA